MALVHLEFQIVLYLKPRKIKRVKLFFYCILTGARSLPPLRRDQKKALGFE